MTPPTTQPSSEKVLLPSPSWISPSNLFTEVPLAGGVQLYGAEAISRSAGFVAFPSSEGTVVALAVAFALYKRVFLASLKEVLAPPTVHPLSKNLVLLVPLSWTSPSYSLTLVPLAGTEQLYGAVEDVLTAYTRVFLLLLFTPATVHPLSRNLVLFEPSS